MEIDNKTYNRLHYSLRTKHGKATKCEFKETCNEKSTKYEWALKKGKEYSDNPKDYYQLCKSCHAKYDYNGTSEKVIETMTNVGKARKGETPPNKGNDSRITINCKSCNKEMKVYKSKGRMFCSRKCRYKDMEGKPSRSTLNKK